ncbi:hypothetical protein MMC06_002705 [Schaereria dolodes]|nr:hypothetical protein [Schaereria dolodes]
MSNAPAPLSNPRVVTTGHDLKGTSVIHTDTHLTPFHPFGPARTGFFNIYETASVPTSLNDIHPAPPAANGIPRCPPGGTIFAISDFPPGAKTPMHRTISLDYAVILSGEIVMHMDGGDETVVRAGDIVVQRGTMHFWENRGTETCRTIFALVASEEVVIDGKKVEGGDV